MCEPPTVAGKELLWVPGIVCASHHCASDQGGAGPHHLCEVTCELREPRVAEVVLADLSVTGRGEIHVSYSSVDNVIKEEGHGGYNSRTSGRESSPL